MQPHTLRPRHQLHLECKPFTLRGLNNPHNRFLLIQPKAPRQITHPRRQQEIRKDICSLRCQFPLRIPPVYTADHLRVQPLWRIAPISRTCDDIRVRRGLDLNHVWDELWVVGEVGVHDDHVVPCYVLEAVDVGGS